MQRVVVLAAGVLTAGVLVRRRRKNQAEAKHSRNQAASGKQQRQIVHAYPSPAASVQRDAASADQQAGPAPDSSNNKALSSMSYAYSSLLLLLSLSLAVYTVAVLILRGQLDLAAAAAITWLLAAPAVLSLGSKQAAAAAAAAASSAAATADSASAVDATMVIADLEPPTKILADYHGTWIKDAAASESMDAAMRLIHLNPLMRQAVKLIRGVQLGIEEERLRFAVFSAISWFKLSEYYPWSGDVCENRRRDMRRGKSQGQVQISSKGTIILHYAWEHPYSGRAVDEFSIDEQGRLRLTTVVTVNNEVVKYVQVYRRKRNSSSSGGKRRSDAGVL